MHDSVFSSIDEMLAPTTLAELIGAPVTDVQRTPANPVGGYSGSTFASITATAKTAGGATTVRLILKRLSLATDHTMWVTDDQQCRAVALWRHGLYQRMPPEIDHAMLACAQDGDGWALLMWDVAPHLFGDNLKLNAGDLEHLVDALAALHAAFWEAEDLRNPALGLSDLDKMLAYMRPSINMNAPRTGSPIPKMILDGWALLPDRMPADAYGLLCELVDDPQPLVTAMATLPRTLVHGDYRCGNLGMRRTPQPQVIVLDWNYTAAVAPTIDLPWLMYLPSHGALSLPTAFARYRRSLEQRLGFAFEDGEWEKQVALGLLVNVIRTAAFKAFFSAVDGNVYAQRDLADLQVQAEQIRAGVRWL